MRAHSPSVLWSDPTVPIVKWGVSSYPNALQSKLCFAASLVFAWILLFTGQPLHGQSSHSFYRSIANHFTYRGGGGLTSPIGGTGAVMNEGWDLGGGIGYRLNRRFSALVEAQIIRTGMGNGLLRYELTGSGSYHIWSVGLTPTYNYWYHGRFAGYVLGGAAYSQTKTIYRGASNSANCYILCAPQIPGSYHTNSSQPMADVGLGFSMRISPQHRYRLYTEARYENFFQNSHLPPYKNVEVIPLTVGIQW